MCPGFRTMSICGRPVANGSVCCQPAGHVDAPCLSMSEDQEYWQWRRSWEEFAFEHDMVVRRAVRFRVLGGMAELEDAPDSGSGDLDGS